MMKNLVVKIRIVFWLILASVAGWLLYMAIVPSGNITYISDFENSSYFIKKLSPIERVEMSINGTQSIIGDPVYFSLRTPRRFDKAILTIKYKNETKLPIIEAGVLVDKKIWRYDLQPVENKIIDELSVGWDRIEDGNIVLLQREKEYETIQEFLDSDIDSEEIALYNYNLENKFSISNYRSSTRERKLDYSLRGDWQILTYIKDEDLNFKFNFTDLNKNKDSDDIDLLVYYGGVVIDTLHINDDGNSSDTGEVIDRGEIELILVNLPEGVYKIELKVNDDIITENIITTQSKFVFLNKIWLADNKEENIILYTDSQSISAQTINPSSLQTIAVNKDELEIIETYKQFNLKLDNELSSLNIPRGDIILSGDGVINFNKNSFFNPAFQKINKDFNVEKGDVNYILARYSTPEEKAGWKIAKAEFDLSNVYREFYKYGFLISVPGLRADDSIDNKIQIDEISFELEGTSLWEKIVKLVK